MSQILQISSSLVVGDGNVKLQNFRPKGTRKSPINLDNLQVTMMRIPEEENQTLKLMPNKITVNSDVLIGKRLSKDIMGKNNELILKQNQIITAKQLVVAKQHEKLNELFYSVY